MEEMQKNNVLQQQYNPIMNVKQQNLYENINAGVEELVREELSDFQEVYKEVYDEDKEYNPFIERTAKIRGLAESFLNVIKDKYPNRYFILKKITKNSDFWDIALNKNLLVLNEDNSIQKLKSVLEISDKIILIFMSIEQKRFLGIAQVQKQLPQSSLPPNLPAPTTPFQITWISNTINMCKEFQEVDTFAAKLLIEMINEPSKAPIPRLNPFSPVVVGEGIYGEVQLIHQTIQYLKNPGRVLQGEGGEDSGRRRKIRKREGEREGDRYERYEGGYERRREHQE